MWHRLLPHLQYLHVCRLKYLATFATQHVSQARPKVVGMGSCGLDYLAQVAAFPQPDDKLRTERLEVRWHGRT